MSSTDKDKQIAAQLQAEIDAKRKQKIRARLSKFLGLKAERAAHDAIPKSKRRWDTNRSRWIEV